MTKLGSLVLTLVPVAFAIAGCEPASLLAARNTADEPITVVIVDGGVRREFSVPADSTRYLFTQLGGLVDGKAFAYSSMCELLDAQCIPPTGYTLVTLDDGLMAVSQIAAADIRDLPRAQEESECFD